MVTWRHPLRYSVTMPLVVITTQLTTRKRTACSKYTMLPRRRVLRCRSQGLVETRRALSQGDSGRWILCDWTTRRRCRCQPASSPALCSRHRTYGTRSPVRPCSGWCLKQIGDPIRSIRCHSVKYLKIILPGLKLLPKTASESFTIQMSTGNRCA